MIKNSTLLLHRAWVATITALAAIAPAACLAAQPVTLTIQSPVVSGGIVTFTGTLLDTTGSPITAQSLTDNFTPASLDDTPFVITALADSPITLQPNTPFDLTLFDLNTANYTPGSTVNGYFDITGFGSGNTEVFDTGRSTFSYDIPKGGPPPVPEPSEISDIGGGLCLIAGLLACRAYKRRQKIA